LGVGSTAGLGSNLAMKPNNAALGVKVAWPATVPPSKTTLCAPDPDLRLLAQRNPCAGRQRTDGPRRP